MSRKLSLSPKKAQPLTDAQAAWWYENKGSIDVFIQRKEGGVVACRIRKSRLPVAT